MAGPDPLNAFLDYPQAPVPNAESGPLAGLSLAVKDICDVAGYPTGCGNPDRLAGAVPAARTAPAVQVLLDAGARFVGKTQTDELAFSLMGQNAHFPHPVNPAAPDRVTGGSSSGSAAAVAGGLAAIATGSDTGGSIRAPAGFCGLIGLRTTHGRISLEGTMPLAPSLDTFGWFAEDVETYETVAKLLLPTGQFRGTLGQAVELAALPALLVGEEEIAEYAGMRATLGPVDTVEWPFTSSLDELYWCFRRLQGREAWACHGAWIEAEERRLGPGVRERFAFGAGIDARIANAEAVRRLVFRGEMTELLGRDRVLVLPTAPGAAPLAADTHEAQLAYREQALRLLCLSGLSGFPQITLPLGTVHGAPFGLSLIGPADSDIALIRLGRRLLGATRNS